MKGKELAMKRKLIGMTQAQLGELVGVSKQEISNIERGKINLPSALDRIIDYEIGRGFVNWKIYVSDEEQS